MNRTDYLRSLATTIAHQIRLSGRGWAEWSYCMRQGWAAAKLVLGLEGRASFQFVKADGTMRQATGTRNASLIPAEHAPAAPVSALEHVRTSLAMPYYDLGVMGWRSFRIDRLATDPLTAKAAA